MRVAFIYLYSTEDTFAFKGIIKRGSHWVIKVGIELDMLKVKLSDHSIQIDLISEKILFLS